MATVGMLTEARLLNESGNHEFGGRTNGAETESSSSKQSPPPMNYCFNPFVSSGQWCSFTSRMEMVKSATGLGFPVGIDCIPSFPSSLDQSQCGNVTPVSFSSSLLPLWNISAAGITPGSVGTNGYQFKSFPLPVTSPTTPFPPPSVSQVSAFPAIDSVQTRDSNNGDLPRSPRRMRRKKVRVPLLPVSNKPVTVSTDPEIDDSAEGDIADDAYKSSKWHKVQKPVAKKPLQPSTVYFGRLTDEKRHEGLKNNPKLARIASADFILTHDPRSDLLSFIKPLLCDEKDKIEMKTTVCMDENSVSNSFSTFQIKLVPILDGKVRTAFLAHTFNDPSEAFLALCIVLRSYVAGFTIHKRAAYGSPIKTISLQCHTRNNRPCSSSKKDDMEDLIEDHSPSEEVERSKCPWIARIKFDGKQAKYVIINSFSDHLRTCFKKYARFTPDEVTFQESFGSFHRKDTMEKLKQVPVRPKTLSQRVYRNNAAINAEIKDEVEKQIEKQEVDSSIYTGDVEFMEIDNNMFRILRYLSMLREKEHSEVSVSFERVQASLVATSINLMWEPGKKLLSTHADVIYCDSLWDVGKNSYFALTIVVIDKNNKLRLVAMSLAFQEEKERWKSFFLWVKSLVPNFNPKFVMTDGAGYIYDAFYEVMGGYAQHDVCWWHRQQNALRLTGKKREFALKKLAMAYVPCEEELNKMKTELKALDRSRSKEVDDAAELVFIKLKVFTGGTLSNSYAESINSMVRRFGAITTANMFDVLLSIHTMAANHNYQVTPPIEITEEVRKVLDANVIEIVSKGALGTFKERQNEANSICKVIDTAENNFTVEDTVSTVTDSGVTLEKNVVFIVDWSEASPKCSCNRLIYAGMPCRHIITAADKLQKLIPLECFNPRFYDDSDIVDAVVSSPPDSSVMPEDMDDNEQTLLLPPVSAEVTEESSLHSTQEQPKRRKTSILLKLVDPEEVTLYYELEQCANSLVEIRAIPNYVERTDNEVLLFASGVTAAENMFRCLCPEIASTTMERDLVDPVLVMIEGGSVNQSMSQYLHIASAGIDSRNPSPEISAFRGKMKAAIIRVLLLHQAKPGSVSSVIKSFQQRVRALVHECLSLPTVGLAGLSPVHGTVTSQSYRKVPRDVAHQCIQQLGQCWGQATAGKEQQQPIGTATGSSGSSSDTGSIQPDSEPDEPQKLSPPAEKRRRRDSTTKLIPVRESSGRGRNKSDAVPQTGRKGKGRKFARNSTPVPKNSGVTAQAGEPKSNTRKKSASGRIKRSNRRGSSRRAGTTRH